MSNLNEFKAELKSRVTDFATSYQLVTGGETKTQKQRDDLNEKGYQKLEKFILEEFNTWLIDGSGKVEVEAVPKENPEDTTISLDF